MTTSIEWVYTNNVDISIEKNVVKGGAVYNHLVMDVLSKNFDTVLTHLPKSSSGGVAQRFVKNLGFMTRLRRYRPSGEIVIRDPVAVAFSNFSRQQKNVAIVHHLNQGAPDKKSRLFLERFRERVVKQDIVVAVSRYWKGWLEDLGCRRVEVIYNAFDVPSFTFDKDELTEFRSRYEIPFDRPVIYIGTSDPKKGGLQVFEALRNSGYFLVASGKARRELPVFTARFPYRDYQRLLKIADISVLMSELEEGWNRTAHESLLCGTPVVGSGSGGMRELLDDSGQVICENNADLKRLVEKVLADKEEFGRRGREFASRFDLERFEQSWIRLMGSLRNELSTESVN